MFERRFGPVALARVLSVGAVVFFAGSHTAIAQDIPLVVQVSTEDGTNPIYQPGEVFQVTLRTNQDAYVQCYYVPADGSVAMIFPNPDQPDNRIRGGDILRVPPDEGNFKLRLTQELTFETVTCFGSVNDTRDWIPPNLSRPLETIPQLSFSDLEAQLLRIRSRSKIAKGSVTIVVSQ